MTARSATALRRLYCRLRSVEIEARELRAGDRLLFDFMDPPQFSARVARVVRRGSSGVLVVWAYLEEGIPVQTLRIERVERVGFQHDERVRVARPRMALPGTSNHGWEPWPGTTRDVVSRGEGGP